MSKKGKTPNNEELDPLSSPNEDDMDLEVTVKGTMEGEEKIFRYNSATLGYYFGFFKTMMSSGMKEAHTKQVTVEDIDPEDFENAVGYLVDPKTCAGLTPANAVKVAYLYDRLESKQGLELVESVIVEALESWDWASLPNAQKVLNEILAAFSKAKVCGIVFKFSHKSMENVKVAIGHFTESRLPLFETEHLRILEPALRDHPDIFEDICDKYCTMHKILMDEVSFPELLQSRMQSLAQFEALREIMPKLKVVVDVRYPSGLLESVKSVPFPSIGSVPKHKDFMERSLSNMNVWELDKHRIKLGRCSAIVPPLFGDQRDQFSYSDWALVLVDGSGRVTHAFVYPGSGYHLLPRKGDHGWVSLKDQSSNVHLSINSWEF